MGRLRVKSNRLPAVAAALPREMDNELGDAARDLANDIEPRLRVDTGLTVATDRVVRGGHMSAVVGVGEPGGAAFYVQFDEFGTHRPNAFGVVFEPRAPVRTAALAFEVAFASRMGEAVQRACRRG